MIVRVMIVSHDKALACGRIETLPRRRAGCNGEAGEGYPGLERVSVSLSVGVPKAVALEQLERFATEVMPAFASKAKTSEPALA